MNHTMGDRVPSSAEFHAAISDGFAFLTENHGFRKGFSSVNDFEVSFAHDRCVIRVFGGGYGQMAWMEVSFDGRNVPYYLLLPSPRTRHFPSTDSPQLDDLREISALLRDECGGLLIDPVRFAESAWQAEQDAADAAQRRRDADPKGTFFSRADALWKNKKWADLHEHLTSSSYPLSAAWTERLSQAHEHTRNQ